MGLEGYLREISELQYELSSKDYNILRKLIETLRQKKSVTLEEIDTLFHKSELSDKAYDKVMDDTFIFFDVKENKLRL